MLRNSASVLLTSLLLAGCSGKEIPALANSKIIDDMPRVQNSTKSPCWQQEQIAAQNSYVETIKGGKEVVYSAPCKTDKPAKEAPAKVAAASRG